MLIPEVYHMNEASGSAYYVFDIAALKQRIEYLKRSLPEIMLCYAVKSNAFIINEIKEIVDRIEICSPGEYAICRHFKIAPEKMVISGVNKSESYIQQVLEESPECVMTIESMRHYQMIRNASAKIGVRPRVIVRLTNDSQFGINADEIIELFRENKDKNTINLVGVQYFSGTQKKSGKRIRREIRTCDELITRIKVESQTDVEEFEYGGGYAVDYFDGDKIDEEELFAATNEAVSEMQNKTLVTLELGRSIVAECGRYYTNIVDIKHNNGMNYVIVDGGMHQLTYDGQVMAMKIPHFHVVGKENAEIIGEYTVCGSLCSMNDILMKQVMMPELEIGDVICFENAGAYSCMEGMALFLSRDLPAIKLKMEDGCLVEVRSSSETAGFNTAKY